MLGDTGECLPDVTLIVPIASYFGITTDELLGVSEEVKRQKIQAWYDDYKPFVYRQTKESEQAHFDGLLRLMEEYPNDFELLNNYIVFAVLDPEFFGQGDQIEKSRKKNYRKIEECCRTILEKCTDEEKRQKAFSELAMLYASDGRLAEAEKLLTENVPFDLLHQKIVHLYESVNHPDIPTKYRQCLYYQMRALIQNLNYYIEWVKPIEKKLPLYQSARTICEAFCGEDLGKMNFYMAHLYYHLYVDFTCADRLDEAVSAAETCLAYVHTYDHLPDEYRFTTGFVEGYVYTTVDELMDAADMTETDFILGLFEQNWATPLREREDFRLLLDKYRMVC